MMATPVSGVKKENAYGKDRRTISRMAESSADKGGISATEWENEGWLMASSIGFHNLKRLVKLYMVG